VIVKVANPSMGIAVSPGTVQAVGAASGAGFVKVGISTQTAQASVANLDTANVIAGALVAAINSANAFPISAAQTAPSDTATLFYQPERAFNFNSAAVSTGITTTLTLAWGCGMELDSRAAPPRACLRFSRILKPKRLSS
jgi:phage tail sheath gpL-like